MSLLIEILLNSDNYVQNYSDWKFSVLKNCEMVLTGLAWLCLYDLRYI